MKYIDFRKKLKEMLVFNTKEIHKIESDFDSRRLYEWQNKKHIIKIHNGYYIFSDIKLNENRLYEIANKIYGHSYISLETALSYYGLIPEQSYVILSISTRKTVKFKTQIGNFYYRKMLKSHFFGYNIEKIGNISWKIASPEKSLIDYFYFNSDIKIREDIIGIRINSDVFKNLINIDILRKYTEMITNQRVSRCVEYLIEEMNNA